MRKSATNLSGSIQVARAVILYFREQGDGQIFISPQWVASDVLGNHLQRYLKPNRTIYSSNTFALPKDLLKEI